MKEGIWITEKTRRCKNGNKVTGEKLTKERTKREILKYFVQST